MSAGPFPAWWKDWTGETCLLVASGPSATSVDLEIARGRVRAIAVNLSWRLCPWADVLYATDGAFWKAQGGVPEFKGLRLTSDERAVEAFGIAKVQCRKQDDRILLDAPGVIGWGGNSGFHALNLAIQFGAAKVILVGFDMTLERGSHWHGEHEGGLHNPTRGNVDRWRRVFDKAAPIAASLGVSVLNCSPGSALESFPKMSLEEALAQ